MPWIIYKHTNLINGKVYIGQTRKKKLEYRTGKNGEQYIRRNPDSHFARAITKYGWENFSHEILEENIATQEIANERESYWISFYDSVKNGYNANGGGNAIGDCSDETREKLSSKSKKMWSSKRKELLQIYQSEEHKNKLSKSIKEYYNNNPEVREKISNNQKNKIKICKENEIKVIDKNDYDRYKKLGWQWGRIYISPKKIENMIYDYQENDFSRKQLKNKYNIDYKIINRLFNERNIKIIDKGYKRVESIKGTHKSKEWKEKCSKWVSESKNGKVYVHKDGICKMIEKNELENYLNNNWERGQGSIKDTTKIKISHSQFKRKVQNVETGEIFDSARDVPNLKRANIMRAIKNSGTAGGYHWKYVEEENDNNE